MKLNIPKITYTLLLVNRRDGKHKEIEIFSGDTFGCDEELNEGKLLQGIK